MPLVTAAGYPTQTGPTTSPAAPEALRGDYQNLPAATPEAFGATVGAAQQQLGRSFEQVGDVLKNAAVARQDFLNKTATDKAVNDYYDRTIALSYGDPNNPNDTGFMGKQGQDAVAQMPDFRNSLDSERNRIRATLTNPLQQLNFDNETRRQQAITLARAGEHFDRQLRADAAATSQAKEANAYRSLTAATAANDDLAHNDSIKVAMNAALAAETALHGTPSADTITKILGNVRENAVLAKVEGLRPTDPAAALQLLQNNRDAVPDTAKYAAKYHELYTASVAQRAQDANYGPVGATTTPRPYPGTSGGLAVGGALRNRVAEIGSEHFLDLAEHFESGGQNIPNYRFDKTHTAGGYFQITDTTWKQFAVEAGVSTAQYPTAMSAPYDVQRNVARQVLMSPNGGGPQHWTNYNASLNHAIQNAKPGDIVSPSAAAGRGIGSTTARPPDSVQPPTPTTTPALTPAAAPGIPVAEPAAVVGSDGIVRPMPSHGDNELLDTQVPGLPERIQHLAETLPPPNTKENRDVWNAAIALARKDMNMAYANQQHAYRINQEQQRALDDKMERDLTHRMFSSEGATMTTQQIENEMNTAGASAAATQRMIGFYERQTKPDPAAAVSRANTSKLFAQIGLEWGDPQKITDMKPVQQAFINQEITKSSYDFLEKQFNETKTVEGENLVKQKQRLGQMYKSSITKSNPLMGQLDEEGDVNFGRFETFVDQQVDRYKAENKNPWELFNENSPNYVGLQVPRFQKTLQQSATDVANKISKTNPAYVPPAGFGTAVPSATPNRVPPRLPRETVEQYNKRIGAQ